MKVSCLILIYGGKMDESLKHHLILAVNKYDRLMEEILQAYTQMAFSASFGLTECDETNLLAFAVTSEHRAELKKVEAEISKLLGQAAKNGENSELITHFKDRFRHLIPE